MTFPVTPSFLFHTLGAPAAASPHLPCFSFSESPPSSCSVPLILLGRHFSALPEATPAWGPRKRRPFHFPLLINIVESSLAKVWSPSDSLQWLWGRRLGAPSLCPTNEHFLSPYSVHAPTQATWKAMRIPQWGWQICKQTRQPKGMEAALGGSPGAHGSPEPSGELGKHQKGGEALAGPCRIHRSPLGGQSGEGHRSREEGQSMPCLGNCENSARVGSWPVGSGGEREGEKGRQGWNRRWGSIMRVLQVCPGSATFTLGAVGSQGLSQV